MKNPNYTEDISSNTNYTQTHDINYLRKCFFNLGRVQFILQKPRKHIYKNLKELFNA